MFRNSRVLLALVAVLAAASFHPRAALASSPQIDSEDSENGDLDLGGSIFQVDLKHGTVSLTLVYGVAGEGGSMPFERFPIQVQVPGLSYDAATHKILYAGAHGPIDCADVTIKRGLLGHYASPKPTGLCTTRSGHSGSVIDVFLDVKDDAPASATEADQHLSKEVHSAAPGAPAPAVPSGSGQTRPR